MTFRAKSARRDAHLAHTARRETAVVASPIAIGLALFVSYAPTASQLTRRDRESSLEDLRVLRTPTTPGASRCVVLRSHASVTYTLFTRDASLVDLRNFDALGGQRLPRVLVIHFDDFDLSLMRLPVFVH